MRGQSYLYHTTSIDNFIGIIDSNTLCVSRQTGGSLAVSLTRDKSYIRPYIESSYVRIALDRSLLARHYKITPYSEMEKKDQQAEEHINRNIYNIRNYITHMEYKLGETKYPETIPYFLQLIVGLGIPVKRLK